MESFLGFGVSKVGLPGDCLIVWITPKDYTMAPMKQSALLADQVSRCGRRPAVCDILIYVFTFLKFLSIKYSEAIPKSGFIQVNLTKRR